MITPRLSARGVSKGFPGVQALADVHVEIGAGEVHALLGENGAGKSTLLKILSGAQSADAGSITLDGVALTTRDTPLARQRRGIVTIYQELTLVPDISIAENIFLGREPQTKGLIDWRAMNASAADVLGQIGLPLDPTAPVRGLSVAQQQMVEIARALTTQARLIIMDEPTAALSDNETLTLHALVKRLSEDGVSILYVTHRLAEVVKLCDRYTILRDGRTVGKGKVDGVTIADLVAGMVGRELTPASRPKPDIGDLALTIAAPKGSAVSRVEVRQGEILGFAGLIGSGRTELLRRLIGADRTSSGAEEIASYRSPAHAARSGIYMVPEDRKAQGCFMPHAINWNLSLISLPRLSRRAGVLDLRTEEDLVRRFIERLAIRPASSSAIIGTLSGGNQQKVLLARCMAASPKVLIVDEPTRGIDIGAKAEVHQILFDLAAEGVAIVVASSDMSELLDLSDRVVVMHEGRIVGERQRAEVEERALMAMMTGANVKAGYADA